MKYSPVGSVIVVAFEKDRLHIKDPGIGMDEETRQRMFDRFYRKNRNEAEGSGIGLAIVEKIAKIYDIQISVISAPSEGTEIILHFPLRSCFAPSRLD